MSRNERCSVRKYGFRGKNKLAIKAQLAKGTLNHKINNGHHLHTTKKLYILQARLITVLYF